MISAAKSLGSVDLAVETRKVVNSSIEEKAKDILKTKLKES
ncbi:hypothetical protein P6N53_00330 [Desulforamulus aquiferis]|uniref:Uncharacterized protein n=1 Tax=Desulforamulus aquiferis TaxID=1397668 RepID=A0AAW7Z8D5_9FIRM|nr:hypothetical protein [Desulforamulus aquiferis]